MHKLYRITYYDVIFQNATDSKRTWQIIIINGVSRSKSSFFMESLNEKIVISDDMNAYFTTIGHHIANNISSYLTDSPIRIETGARRNGSFFLTTTDHAEISNLINTLYIKKCPGYDAASVINLCSTAIVPILTHTTNLSLVNMA